jgi:hypothetical protein
MYDAYNNTLFLAKETPRSQRERIVKPRPYNWEKVDGEYLLTFFNRLTGQVDIKVCKSLNSVYAALSKLRKKKIIV